MSCAAGPDINENGLVLALDAGNSKGFDDDENLMTNSQLGTTILNDGGGVTLTTDTTIVNPFGVYDGVLKCVHTTNTPGYFRRGQNMSLTAGVTYTFSFYFKNGTVSNPYGQNPINFGILASTYSPTFQELSQSLNTNIDVGNGWYRQVFTFTPSYTQTYQVDFNQANNQTPLGTYYLYGFKLERGSSVTDYYATTGTAKTRGPTLIDMTGRGSNGTLTNGPTYSSANGGSIVFDGTNDYVTLSSSQLAPGTGAFTWNFWIKLNDVSNLSIIFSGTGSNSSYGVIFANSAGYGLGYYASGYAIVDSPTLGSSWWYITFTGNGGADGSRNLKLYRNTIQAGSTYTNNYNFTSSTPIIGANHSSFAELMRGNISNVSYYNRALTAAEIQQNYRATKSRYGL